jgi:hypothetical protein
MYADPSLVNDSVVHLVTVRLTDEESRQLNIEAGIAGVSRGQMLRELFVAGLAHDMEALS